MHTVDEVRCYQNKLTFRRQTDAGKIQSVARRSGLMCCGGSNRNESKSKTFFFVPVVIGHIVKAVK